MSLEGRAILVTGAAGCLGSATARALAGAGAKVALADLDMPTLPALEAELAATAEVAALVADVATEEGAEQAVRASLAALGGLDGVVHCAFSTALEPPLEMTAADFQRSLAGTLLSSFLVAREAARVMAPTGRGSVVLLGSVAGVVALSRGTAAYGAAKAGVHALVRELAVDFGPHGVRVNAVAPVRVRTPRVQAQIDAVPEARRAAFVAELAEGIPLGRIAEPEDVAGPCLFLLDDAAALVTGHVLFVDGGLTAH